MRGRFLPGMLALLAAAVFLLSGWPVSQAGYQPAAIVPVAAWPEEISAAGPALDPPPGWVIERPDAPHLYRDMGPRSLALDAAGYPHIAYGADSLYYAWHDGTAWHIETADTAGGVGRYTSLALDGAGRPHISYYDSLNGDLKYARYDGSSWQIVAVDTAGNVGQYTGIALDGAGRPRISYYDASGANFKYAAFDGVTWQLSTPDSTGNVGRYTSLALDGAGRPHISYYDDTGDNLKYARYTGSAWQISTVDSAGFVGTWTSIALNAAGQPRISYYDSTTGNLKYASYNGSAWQTSNVGLAGPGNTSLALDSLERPHIAYLAMSPAGCLKHTYLDGGSWQSEVLEGGLHTGATFLSLALDPGDHAHISYPNDYTGVLRYAHYDGTAWQKQDVDQAGVTGQYTSMRLDAQGEPHVAYYADWPEYDLRYAYRDGGTWSIQAVDGSGVVGKHPSLALDAGGRPHISYHDYTNRDLKYAYYDGSAWQIAVVDPNAGVESYTSLALDAAGHPHIAYTDGGTWCCAILRYAYYDGSAWQLETVDGALCSGGWLSLALDAAGRPHISYMYADSPSFGTPTPVPTVPPTPTGMRARSTILPRGTAEPADAATLRYARHDGTAWQLESVDVMGSYSAGHTSLALDADGRPHIAYTDAYRLKYASFDGVAWGIEVVDSVSYAGYWASLALDDDGRPRISYMNVAGDTLKYTEYDGTLWNTLTLDGPLGGWSGHTSLALDADGWPHISYYDDANSDLKYIYFAPSPVEAVEIAGLLTLPTGITGLYTATYSPPTATLPVTLAWDNGAAGPTAVYSWTAPGVYTMTVTATNVLAHVSDTLAVTVFCQEATAVQLDGPAARWTGQEGTYQAAVLPITASRPLTLTWDNGAIGPSAVYSWTVPGSYTVTATATNACGQRSGTFSVTVLCVPVAGATVAGPRLLLTGETGIYTATYAPPTPTLPLALAWDNGAAGPTAAYSWTAPGVYTVTVTATNPCGEAHAAYTVTVCRPVAGVAIAGPAALLTGEPGVYTATYTPPDASPPLTITWSGGAAGPTAAYSWTAPGVYTVTVTATNPCGEAHAAYTVTVCRPAWRVYLPLVETAVP